MKLKSLLTILFITSLILIGCEKKSNEPIPIAKAQPVNTNKIKDDAVKAPPFQLQSTNGSYVKLSDYKGKIVILDFWATWCPPCREEIPHFVELQKEYNFNLQILGISLDQETINDLSPFMKKYNMNYPVLFANNQIVNDYGGIESIPTTFIIDQKGNVANVFIGYHDKSIFVGEIERLLKGS